QSLLDSDCAPCAIPLERLRFGVSEAYTRANKTGDIFPDLHCIPLRDMQKFYYSSLPFLVRSLQAA
ncbi:MAG TPA: hypothetical protein VIQ31_30295, partial [Phormidium sp.]